MPKKIILITSLLALAACSAPPAPPASAESKEDAAPAIAAPQEHVPVACEQVRAMFDDLVERKEAGLTMLEALAELSDRGAYTESYVVDAVYGLASDGNVAVARVDVMAKCRTVHKTGATY